MLKGSAAVLTRWAGEGRTDTSAWSQQLATGAAQGSAGAHALSRKENPPSSRYETSGFGIKGRLVAPLPLSFVKGFLKVPAHGTNPWTIMVKWGRRGRKGKKLERSGVLGFGKPHDGQGGRQNRRLAITAPQHPGEHSSLLRQFTALTPSPSDRLAGLQTGHRKSVVSIIHSTLCV